MRNLDKVFPIRNVLGAIGSDKLVLTYSLGGAKSGQCGECFVFIGYNFHIRAPRHIRPQSFLEAAKHTDADIVGSRLDYCNSLLCGPTERNPRKLGYSAFGDQFARVVCQAPLSVPLKRDFFNTGYPLDIG
jgi:hypothetical protein